MTKDRHAAGTKKRGIFVTNDILKNISSIALTMAKNQRIVADYIMNNWEIVLRESSVSLAKRLHVSQSTVIRTIRGFGYAGFPDFQNELGKLLQEKMSTRKRIEEVSVSQKGKNIEEIISNIFELQKNNINMTKYNLDFDAVLQSASVIWAAQNVLILGLRTSAGLAHYLGLHLSMIRKNINIFWSDYSLIENIQTVNKRDVVIAFSFSRYYKTTIEAVELAKNRNCKIIGITDNVSSPLTALSDHIFYVPVTSMHFSSSYVSAFALIDVLLNTVGLTHKKEAACSLEAMEEGFRTLKTHIYSPIEDK